MLYHLFYFCVFVVVPTINKKKAGERCNSVRSNDSLESQENYLFQELYASYLKKDVGIKEMAAEFINDQLSRNSWIPNSFSDKRFGDLFIKYSTSISSNAAVQRILSLAKDIMRPTRSRLIDKRFEMVMFLRGNKM